MWQILEHKRVSKSLKGAPIEVQKRYEKWKYIVSLSGPSGLRKIKGLHDDRYLENGKDTAPPG